MRLEQMATPSVTLWGGYSSLLEWTYAGVDCNLPGNCGDACVYFIPTLQKILESSFIIPICILEMVWGWRRIQERVPEKAIPESLQRSRDPTFKTVLLISMCVCFGMEMGYKMASNQMIWVLNPCHLITLVEIYVLAAAPSRTVLIVFRCLCQALNGPTMALLFPVIHTRLLPFEVTTYYIQHTLILVVPVYLLKAGDGLLSQNTADNDFHFTSETAEPISLILPPTEFYLGIADLTGELMRLSIIATSQGDLKTPFEVVKFMRQIYTGFLLIGNQGPKEMGRKCKVLKQSLEKVERACYTLRVRGSEIPTHMLADVFKGYSDPDQDEGFEAD